MMLIVNNVTKKYCSVTALENVSFMVQPNEIVGLVGANGAGKTTAIKLLTNILDADSGEIILDGTNIVDLCDYRIDKIAYIPDDPIYYEFLSVNEHLLFIKSMFHHGVYNMEEVINLFSLNAQLDKMPYALSKGNKQKLMIATALMRNFEYLIADEPFTGLDPRQINILKKVLLELRKHGKGVLLSTHLLDVIDLFCDRYIMLNNGKVLACGTKKEIAMRNNISDNISIEEIYLRLVEDEFGAR